MAEEKDNNRVPEAELILPRGKKVILQAEDTDYKRGLIVELLDNGGYEMAYWYDKPDKPYPVEILVDGQSIKPDGKIVEMKFHPKDYYDEQDLNESGADTSWEDEDGNKITLQDILELTKNIPQKDYPTEKLAKVVLNWDNNPEEVDRISQVEISKQYPILIMVDEGGKIQWILDGNHRAQKALRAKSETIPAKLIKPSNLDARAKKIFNLKEIKGKAAPYGSGYERVANQVKESLRDWFKKENWVRINTSGNISGDCGTMKKGKATTRCLPKKKAQSLTKAQRKATVAKKVRGDKKGKQFVSNTKSAKYRKKSN